MADVARGGSRPVVVANGTDGAALPPLPNQPPPQASFEVGATGGTVTVGPTMSYRQPIPGAPGYSVTAGASSAPLGSNPYISATTPHGVVRVDEQRTKMTGTVTPSPAIGTFGGELILPHRGTPPSISASYRREGVNVGVNISGEGGSEVDVTAGFRTTIRRTEFTASATYTDAGDRLSGVINAVRPFGGGELSGSLSGSLDAPREARLNVGFVKRF